MGKFWTAPLAALMTLGLLWGAQAAEGKGETPRNLTRLVAEQFMSGKLDAGHYGADIMGKWTADHNFAGPVKDLVSWGPIVKVTEVDSKPLPGGHVYSMIVKQEHGYSSWVIGVSTKTKLIEYVHFINGAAESKPVPAPAAGAPAANGNAKSAPPAPPADTGNACQKYPTLC